MNPNGILLVDKPSEWTSFDVVAKVRSVLRHSLGASKKIKVGHTGTLDPLATGLLVLLIGDYTKRAQEFSKLDKTYEVTVRLGQTSTTGDEEGEKQKVSDRQPTAQDVQDVLRQFEGDIKQVPPAYSAVKIDGQRAYKLARKGREVKLEPRPVKIYAITEVQYSYPDINFTARVSSGTYIRSIAEDIGQKLGTGAYLTALRRTKVGEFSLNQAVFVDRLSENTLRKFIPPL